MQILRWIAVAGGNWSSSATDNKSRFFFSLLIIDGNSELLIQKESSAVDV